MAKKDEPKTVTLYTSNGTQVTVTEELAKKLGGGYSTTKPKSS